MNSRLQKLSRGFTLVEILITLAVLVLLASLGFVNFSDARKNKLVETITNEIVFKLEEAKSNAQTGKNGSSFGVKFNPDSYVTFNGSSYIPSNEDNQIFKIDSAFEMTNTITSSDDAVIFSRITGTPSATGTTTISEIGNPSRKREIYIGPFGDISVIKY